MAPGVQTLFKALYVVIANDKTLHQNLISEIRYTSIQFKVPNIKPKHKTCLTLLHRITGTQSSGIHHAPITMNFSPSHTIPKSITKTCHQSNRALPSFLPPHPHRFHFCLVQTFHTAHAPTGSWSLTRIWCLSLKRHQTMTSQQLDCGIGIFIGHMLTSDTWNVS